MENLFTELNIPKKCIKNTKREDRFEVVVYKPWLKTLIKQSKLIEFSEKPNFEVWPETEDELGQEWMKIFVRVFLKSESKVIPLPKIRGCIKNEPPLMFSQLLQYVSVTNYKNLWKEAYKKYSSTSEIMQNTQITLSSYNEVLREVITRTYGCSIVNICDNSLSVQSSDNYDTPSNIVPAALGLETLNAIFLLHISYFHHSLHDCISFSPAILDKCFTKPLFIVYQLLHSFKSLHDRSLTLGDIALRDIYLNEDLWIQIFPQLLSNMHIQDLSSSDNKKTSNIPECQKIGHKFHSNMKCYNCGMRMYDKVQVSNEPLHKLCELWVHGGISNFTYITALNNASGRTFGDPRCHHVFPWVTDFTSPCGRNWRDLKKSKYRLNKGDCQLDLTFENSQTQVPHHVSDVLSPITYYVYMARRTPKSVLCKNVRSNWVPAEYPISIQRMQQWTPDECIPEFFTDPTVFKSIHDDLDDLEVPPWSCSPEDFVQQHREILESPHVSERLHHWIDLTFGYKLSGNAAIKSKNVCLPLVDGHKNLTKSGLVQLFSLPHPPKATKSVFWAKSPPKIYVEKPSRHRIRDRSSSSIQNSDSRNESETSLNDDNPQAAAKVSPLAISRLLSRSRSSLSEDQRDNNKLSRSPSAQRSASVGPKSSSPSLKLSSNSHLSVPKASLNDGVIYLPKEYNPALALASIEQFHSFLSKTFHEEQYKHLEENFSAFALQEGRQDNNTDCPVDDSVIQNAFTNRYFSENVFCKAGNNYDDCATRYSNYKKYASRKQKNENQIICNYGEIITARKVRELQILGCLIVEIFLGKQLRTFNRNNGELSFPDRLKACVTVLRSCNTEIPVCIKYLANLLLQPTCTDFSNFKYPTVTDLGLPPPSPHLLLEPLLHCVIPFPKPFFKLYYLLSSLKDFAEVSRELDILYHFICDGQKCLEYENIERTKILFAQNIGECKVKKCARNLEILMKDLNATTDLEVVCLLLPFIRDLLEDPSTSVLAAWYLFDPVASMLGPKRTTENFLIPLLKLYENELNQFTIPFYIKSAKLYHHSFLLRLIVRFGLKTFLNNFVTALVEGVGGYRDNDKADFILHTHVQKAFRKCSNLRSMDSEDNNDISPDDNPSSSSEKVEQVIAKSPTKEKSAPEPEVFEFENDPDSDQCYQSLIEQLELNICSELPLNHSAAEEALDASIAENVEQLRGLEELNLNLTDTDSTKEEIGSPTISIPSQNVANIPCETGSKKNECEYFSDKKSNEVKFDLDSSSSKSLKLDRSKSSDCSQSISSGSFLSEHSKSLSQLKKSEGKISEMSADSIIWLSHRLGPVLTAKYLSRNLLKMLTLCYVGNENLVFVRRDSGTNYNNDGTELISIASSRVIGDGNAAKVLECLSHIAGLYGEQLILLQYLPHMSEMINLCKKRLTPNLEGGLISCLALLQHIIPYLSDSMLMHHLQDFILKGILHPIIRLLGTTKYCFPSSYTARDILARKYLDTLYLLSLRIGVEMTREHLIVPALQRFFMIFDKAAGTVTATEKREMKNNLLKESSPSKSLEESHFIEVRRDGSMMEWAIGGTPIKFSHIDDEKIVESLSPLPNKEDTSSTFSEPLNQALQELRAVFTAELAHTAYIPFLKQVGLPTLTSTLLNHTFIRNLCEEYEQEVKLTYPNINQNMTFLNSNASDIYKPNASKSSIGSNVALIGNRIDVQNESVHSNSVDILSLVSNKMENSTRHLRGNWLAYWEHEIGRSDKDLMFNFKQIRLQSFSGHSNSVKCLHVLDNENSFMSGSRDKTVKLWSLRSQGDGSSVSTCQWTYTAHKKSILAITFLESMRLVASCDSIVHIWDPFMGVNVGYLESTKYPPVNMLRSMPSPSSLLYATTTDGTVRVIDARICSYVHELKVSITPGGLIRCLAIAPSGNWVATGQSSGQITVLDGRTGLIISSWRAHEGEVLQLIALNESTLISSSLDQVTGVWNPQDGKHRFQMKGNTEPVHCLLHYNNELISGTTANRIGVHTSIDRDACFSSTKLRSDAFKGLLTSMALLPLNRLLLLGADNGNITLLC